MVRMMEEWRWWLRVCSERMRSAPACWEEQALSSPPPCGLALQNVWLHRQRRFGSVRLRDCLACAATPLLRLLRSMRQVNRKRPLPKMNRWSSSERN